MISKPVEGIDSLKDCVCRGLKLSERLRWRDEAKENGYLMIPLLLSVCVVKPPALEPIKTVDEWDEWAGEDTKRANLLFNQCMAMVGTVDDAKKK